MAELLLSCQEISKSFGAVPLFEGLSLGVSEGDHIGVVGPNGSGKSTLLRILAGEEPPSSGTRSARRRLRVGCVPQEPRFAPGSTVTDVLLAALADVHVEAHDKSTRVAMALGRAGFLDPSRPVDALSGGWRKRLAIAREIIALPDLLLLDEPTNHLDIDGILWLEAVLLREPEAFVVVSHDRYFLESVAGRMIELNRAYAAGLLDVRGSYSRFLEKKDDLLLGQAAYQDSLRNRVRGEIQWLSRKARARTRKAQARIDEAGRLQDELRDLDDRSRTGSVDIDFSGTERRTKRLLVADGLAKGYGGRSLLSGLDLVLGPGTRLGLLGGNGSGKSTLLRLLAGIESPDAGTISLAPNVSIVHFDQHRTRLDPEASLVRALAPGGDSVIYRGRAIHVAGWAKRFLFRQEQLETPVGRLSGGEQARVLIAKLMLEPADILLLDEPTNDLDIDTLDVLEESLMEFPGALVLVTHDRYLLDRVSKQILAFDGQGGTTFFADYAQWEEGRRSSVEASAARPRAERAEGASKPRRLGYLEKREWDGMEERILEAEGRLEACRQAAVDPAVVSDHVALAGRLTELEAAQTEVDGLYARWAELEAQVAD